MGVNIWPDGQGNPVLLMVSLAAIATLPVRQFEQIANSLGYGRVAAWAT